MGQKSFRFNSWVKHFGDKDKRHSCSFYALVSLWLGKFVFCDFSPDCMHERVFPLALAIARGDVIPLAPMFLGYLYRLLDQVHLLEKGAAGTMAVESFLNSSFLQVFLWEHINGLAVHPLPHSQAGLFVRAGDDSYTPDVPLLISRWFRRKPRKGQNFLELLDDIQHFVFRPYTKVPVGFAHVSFYAGVGETSIIIPRGEQSRKDAYLNMAGLPLFTFGDDHSEVSVHYLTHRVRRQFGLDQGVPTRPDFRHPLEMHKLEDAFSAFMVFFDSDTRILRSTDELLPLCYEFRGYETFRGAQVFPETVKVLSKFFDSYEARIESARNLSFSLKNLAFRGLGLSLYSMDVTSYSEISDHKLLCWRDTIRDAISYGLQVGFLLDILKMRLARAVFETRAACSAAISIQFLKVGAATQALKLKHQELDSECHKLRELLLEKGISSDNAGYVLEVAKGSPCNASSILYDIH
ncbi:uncharacterized protein Pyn_40296 [Prunus yedoensis var. nudiflora]|uniref:Aminotransferase-like plant mobile domain-containing protein n=1 Tax=Prunus yedoensis var. nudiflora TaxID=2094558 RepID=A0A314UID4_PRUYE|nr:uncharacterized protein Pyn_40296 [Prunus yedoensis var. nudiflora]